MKQAAFKEHRDDLEKILTNHGEDSGAWKKAIYVYQYKGYRGGYALSRERLWRCTIVGANGKKREESGYRDKFHALEDAAGWAEFLGWPVVDLGRCEAFDDAPRG